MSLRGYVVKMSRVLKVVISSTLALLVLSSSSAIPSALAMGIMHEPKATFGTSSPIDARSYSNTRREQRRTTGLSGAEANTSGRNSGSGTRRKPSPA
jgi:hypothetical protein